MCSIVLMYEVLLPWECAHDIISGPRSQIKNCLSNMAVFSILLIFFYNFCIHASVWYSLSYACMCGGLGSTLALHPSFEARSLTLPKATHWLDWWARVPGSLLFLYVRYTHHIWLYMCAREVSSSSSSTAGALPTEMSVSLARTLFR